MKITLAFLALALAPAYADVPQVSVKADPSLVVPAEVKVYVPVAVHLKGAAKTTKCKWKVTPEPAWSEKLPDDDGVGFRFTGPPAKYQIRVDYVDFKKELWGDASAQVSVVGDAPPGPGPPPGPTPGPVVTGIDLPGFHVLIKYARDETLRPAGEHSILYSESATSVRQYLKAACQTAPDGMGFRFYPAESVGVTGAWKAAFDRTHTALPWAVVSKNGKGWEGSIAGWSPEQFIAKCKEIEALP